LSFVWCSLVVRMVNSNPVEDDSVFDDLADMWQDEYEGDSPPPSPPPGPKVKKLVIAPLGSRPGLSAKVAAVVVAVTPAPVEPVEIEVVVAEVARPVAASETKDLPVVPKFYWGCELFCAGQKYNYPRTEITQEAAMAIFKILKQNKQWLMPVSKVEAVAFAERQKKIAAKLSASKKASRVIDEEYQGYDADN